MQASLCLYIKHKVAMSSLAVTKLAPPSRLPVISRFRLRFRREPEDVL